MDGRGLCGTFDNNPTNELTHRSGFVDKMPSDGVPESFTESWKYELLLIGWFLYQNENIFSTYFQIFLKAMLCGNERIPFDDLNNACTPS